MATPAQFLQALHVAQAALAAYGAYHSYTAIVNLQKYEETTKKAAKWSNEAQYQLDMTRTTQGTGAIAIFASISASLTLAFGASYIPHWLRFTLSPALLLGLVASRQYIKRFWTSGQGNSTGKKIPLPTMGDFNDAKQSTSEVLKSLEWLEYSWVATTFGWGMVGA